MTGAAKKNGSLLIVDDDSSNLMMLTHVFMSEYKVLVAKDGETALERAGKSPVDLILLDIVMPGMSGYDVLARLKENESTRNIPVILISGKEIRIPEGAVDFIHKPINETAIKDRVRCRLVNRGK